MTAELLGWVGALKAFGNALVVRIRDCRSRGCSLPAPVQSPSRRVPGWIALRGEQGFTLTEIMVAISIVGVLSATAAPSLMAMIAIQRVKTATFDFYAALAYARSEAIKRNSVVAISPRGGNFANGYDLDASGVVLRSQLGSPAVTISAPGIALA